MRAYKYYGGSMGILKEVTKTVKNIFSADDDMIFEDENEFEVQQQPQNPFLKKVAQKKPVQMPTKQTVTPNFDLSDHSFGMAKAAQNNRDRSNGKIQIYVPKTYEEAFAIIRDVKAGFTAMVNVEVANPQISQRLIDVVSGAIYALDGDCKKMGEKQYIFSLSAETIGAYDYLPVNGEQSMPQSAGVGFNFNFGQNYDFNQAAQNPNQGFNAFNQQASQNAFNQGGQNAFQQGNFNQNNFNQNAEKLSQDLHGFYVPPKSQF